MQNARPSLELRKFYLPLALLILLVAAGLRLGGLSTYPPGPHYDEGANILIARSVAFGGAALDFFPIVPNYQGREILYYYLATPLLHIIPDSSFALRVTSALLGIVTVAASIGLGRAMFQGQRGLVIGLSVGVMSALSFPLIFLSRQAFRAVTLPFCQALALLFLWRGLTARRRDGLWLAGGGFMAGAALYTYMASRLFPIWLLISLCFLLIADRLRWRLRLRQVVIFLGVLAITALPMGIFALQNSDIFMGRLDEVTIHGAEHVSLLESIGKHLRMFFIEGDHLLRYNIPARPYLTWPEGVLLLVGMGVAGWQIVRRRGTPLYRGALALALLAPLMVIPSVIALGGYPPNHMRSVGMVPLVFVLVAVGFEWIVSGLAARIRMLAVPHSVAALVLVTVLLGGFSIGHDYFAWASSSELYFHTDNDLADAGDWLKSEAGEFTRIYLTTEHFGHPTITSDPNMPPLLWQRDHILYWPPEAYTGLYVYRRDTKDVPLEWLRWLEPYTVEDLPLAPDGAPAFAAYRVPPGTPPPFGTQGALAAGISNPVLSLFGMESTTLAAGEAGAFTMAWRVEQSPSDRTLMPIVQIEDEIGTVLARQTVEMIETDRWLAGEVVSVQVPIILPPGTPPGEYLVRVTWVDRVQDTYIAFLDESGRQGQVWATVGRLTVERPAAFADPATLEIPVRTDTALASGVTLLGWNLPAAQTLASGEAISGVLFWQAGDSPPFSDLQYEIVLSGAQAEYVLWQGGPVRGRYPTTGWLAGELVTDYGRWTIPREVENGAYVLLLRTTEGGIPLSTIEITGQPRLFEQPSSAVEVGASFGDVLLLDGYTQVVNGTTPHLDLVWLALEPVAQDYTVFVHLVNESGQIAAQRDVMPQNNGYPTSRWVSGEYIQDSHEFSELPPGTYQVRVGFYLQADGSRLLAADGNSFIWLGAVTVEE